MPTVNIRVLDVEPVVPGPLGTVQVRVRDGMSWKCSDGAERLSEELEAGHVACFNPQFGAVRVTNSTLEQVEEM